MRELRICSLSNSPQTFSDGIHISSLDSKYVNMLKKKQHIYKYDTIINQVLALSIFLWSQRDPSGLRTLRRHRRISRDSSREASTNAATRDPHSGLHLRKKRGRHAEYD